MKFDAAAGETEGAQEDIDCDLRLLPGLGRRDRGDDGDIAPGRGATDRHDVNRDVPPSPAARHLVQLLRVANAAVRNYDDCRR